MKRKGRAARQRGPSFMLAAAMLAPGGCDRGPEAPSAEQNRQMDDAEALLNEAPAALNEVDDSELAGAANDSSGAAPPP